MPNDYLYNKKEVIIMTVIILVLGTILYFGTGAYKQSSMTPAIDKDVLTLLQYSNLKAAYNEKGQVLVFASARYSDIDKLDTVQGESLPEEGELVIGNVEGSMMRDKKLFNNIGDTLVDFGLTFTVVGILSKTNTFADDFHFINSREYDLLQADENVLLIKFKDPKTPKLFYLYSQNSPSSVNISLNEGNMLNYNTQIMDAKVYYPIILGFDEAKMMREEKLFTNTGDIIYDFFGRDVIIIGIMEKTGTSMDMMHIVQPDFFEEQITGRVSIGENMKKEFKIKGMHCKSCVMILDENLKEIKGVKNVSVSLEKNTAVVEFDDKLVKEKQLIDAVEKDGYKILK